MSDGATIGTVAGGTAAGDVVASEAVAGSASVVVAIEADAATVAAAAEARTVAGGSPSCLAETKEDPPRLQPPLRGQWPLASTPTSLSDPPTIEARLTKARPGPQYRFHHRCQLHIDGSSFGGSNDAEGDTRQGAGCLHTG